MSRYICDRTLATLSLLASGKLSFGNGERPNMEGAFALKREAYLSAAAVVRIGRKSFCGLSRQGMKWSESRQSLVALGIQRVSFPRNRPVF